MLTYSPSCGTSCVHVESGSEGTAASVEARLLQLPCFFFHSVEMLLLQDLEVKCKRERDRDRDTEGEKFFRLFQKDFLFNPLIENIKCDLNFKMMIQLILFN